MKVADFFSKVRSDVAFGAKSRVLVIRNAQEQKELRLAFEGCPGQFSWVRLSKCVLATAFVPPADQVLADVRAMIAKVNAEGKMAYVMGLSAMLAIWDNAERAEALNKLRDLLDDGSLRFYAFVNSFGDEAQTAFSHPRYADGHSVLVVGEKPDEEGIPDIRLVSSEISSIIAGANKSSLAAFLDDFERGVFDHAPINIQIRSFARELPAVGGTIKQVFRPGDYLRLFCNYQGGLGPRAEKWLFAKMREANTWIAAKDFAQNYFFKNNLSGIRETAPCMLLNCGDEEQEVLLWMLRLSLQSGSYLFMVLEDEHFEVKRFKSIYVNKAVELIGSVEESRLCSERKAGIAAILKDWTISLDAEIADFIAATKGVDAYHIVPWLTNQTNLEVQECVRRLRQADLLTIPAAFFEAFPLLEDYLAPYALGNAQLEAYFTSYRAHKVANNVPEDFCRGAKDIQYPVLAVKSREDLLHDSAISDAMLLVVDAMGLEYLPMIISMARKRSIGIAAAVPAMVKLPTSTKFNPIDWPNNQRVNGIPDLDNIIHNGAHVHGVSTDEENFIALLNVFDKVIMPKVATVLATHKRVILTADHGASRLAVLANKEGLTRTLSIRGADAKAEDWRYLAADPNVVPPAEVASNIAGDYWVVKGYDRFSKSGGKLNELHGGLTYEEVLVPFVVFEKGATFTPVAVNTAAPAQFVENDDFDL